MTIDVKSIVQDAVRSALSDNTIILTPDSAAYDYEGWDSVAYSHIILEIEERLEIVLPIIEVMEIQTVGELFEISQKTLDKKYKP